MRAFASRKRNVHISLSLAGQARAFSGYWAPKADVAWRWWTRRWKTYFSRNKFVHLLVPEQAKDSRRMTGGAPSIIFPDKK